MSNIFTIMLGIVGVFLGFVSMKKAINRNKLIDTESIAVVTDVQDLGISEGRKAYAIKYNVQAHLPFDIIVSPCKKKKRPGTKRTIFYEQKEPTNNYYFKSIAQFDRRLLPPSFLLMIGVILIIGGIVKIIGL